MSESKKTVAEGFSDSVDYWKTIYDPEQAQISKCYSLDMIRRKAAVFHLMEKYTNKTLSILDAGCGPGVFMEEAANRGHHVVGIDISRLMVSRARSTTNHLGGEKMESLQADVEHLPFRDGSFDVIFSVGVLSYLANDAKSIGEFRRVVKDDGFVILGLPNWLRLPILFDPYYYLNRSFMFLWNFFFHNRNQRNELLSVNQYRRYFAWQLPDLFHNLRFRIVERINVGFGPPTFWKKEFIPDKYSLIISRSLERLAQRRLFLFLNVLTNHWVICLQKTQD